jgi:hypothetical protein
MPASKVCQARRLSTVVCAALPGRRVGMRGSTGGKPQRALGPGRTRCGQAGCAFLTLHRHPATVSRHRHPSPPRSCRCLVLGQWPSGRLVTLIPWRVPLSPQMCTLLVEEPTRRVAVIPAHPIRVATVAPELGAGRRRPRSGGRGGAGAADADNTAQAGRGGHRQHQGETDVTHDRDPQPVVHLYLPWYRGCRVPHGGRAPASRVTAPPAPAPRVGFFGDAEKFRA